LGLVSLSIKFVIIFTGMAVVHASDLYALTFKPASPDQVLATLSGGFGGSDAANGLSALRDARRKNPKSVVNALALTDELLKIGRSTGLPRFYGEAEAVLAPWWQEKTPPTDVLLRRANIYQFNHQFGLALQDLEVYLRANPTDSNARLMEATINMIIGRYAQAKHSCGALPAGRNSVVRTVCGLAASAMLGNSKTNFTIMTSMFASSLASANVSKSLSRGSLSDVDKYIKTVTADMALQLNATKTAQKELMEIYQSDPADRFNAINLTDVFLDQNRYLEASRVVCQFEGIQAAVLRCARAMRILDPLRFRELVGRIASEVKADTQRGTSVHQREAAYFYLYLNDDPSQALMAAKQNFELQKEPIDARLLLESAFASGKFFEASSALRWMEETSYKHERFLWLKDQMRGVHK